MCGPLHESRPPGTVGTARRTAARRSSMARPRSRRGLRPSSDALYQPPVISRFKVTYCERRGIRLDYFYSIEPQRTTLEEGIDVVERILRTVIDGRVEAMI